MHVIRMDIIIAVVAAAVLAASVKATAVIRVATVSAAMESLVTNVTTTAKLSVNAKLFKYLKNISLY